MAACIVAIAFRTAENPCGVIELLHTLGIVFVHWRETTVSYGC